MKKRMYAVLTAMTAAMMLGQAYGEDMEVQVLSAPEEEVAAEPVSLDDIKIDGEAEIPGYALIKPTAYEVADYLLAYCEGDSHSTSRVYADVAYSGTEADYICLKADITNTATSPKNYLDNAAVSVFYDDDYEYAGWVRQFDYDAFVGGIYELIWNGSYYYPYNEGDGIEWLRGVTEFDNTKVTVNTADEFEINPLYQGHYLFGCTLPNAVINGSGPLRMVITLDGNEITYNIRE